ncbi:MAG: alkaline phosphatase [Fibrobacteres bacterium]|nr:alkaline phosphatase [Fibrobacterota bacterium]
MIFSFLLSGLLSASSAKAPKYVFLFVGDGMGLAQVSLAEAYRASVQGDSVGFWPTSFSRFPVVTVTTTHCATRRITESAAAGTALATGHKAGEGSLGLDTSGTSRPNLVDLAKARGMATGLATTVSVDHATPGAFYAHVSSRNEFHRIGKQATASKLDFLAGAPFLAPDSAGLPSLWDIAKDSGFGTIHGRAALAARTLPRVMALPAGPARSALPYALDRAKGDTSLVLADLVREGARILERASHKGFFLMAEAGKVDWASHRNDARAMIGEVWDLDSAVQEALAFAKRHPKEVLIVVTADHETGGLALGAGRTGYWTDFGLLRHQTLSQEAMEDSLARPTPAWDGPAAFSALARWTGLGERKGLELDGSDSANLRETLAIAKPKLRAQTLAALATRMLAAKAGIGWTSGAHTAIPVPVYAWGIGADAFQGRLDNTDIHRIIARSFSPGK